MRRVIKSIKQGTIYGELPILDVPDVVGMKVIVEDHALEEFLGIVREHPACAITEVERHDGVYKAVNLHVAYTLPRRLLRANPPSDRYLEVLVSRGFVREEITRDYEAFVDEAEPQVTLEIIVSSFQEFLESEIGRCMHEERVLSQRSRPDYRGPLATNVRYLMNYVLSLCRSPRMEEIDDIPIKLWGRYMTDTVSYFIRALFLPADLYFDALPAVVEVGGNGDA